MDGYNVPTEVMFERWTTSSLQSLYFNYFSRHDDCNYDGQQYYEETNDVFFQN